MTAVAVVLLAAVATAQDTEQSFTSDTLTAKTQPEEKVTEARGQMTSEATDGGKKSTSTPSDEGRGTNGNVKTFEDTDLQPKQEMVSFTVNLPLNSLNGAAAGDFLFGDMLSSFGSLFSNLFSVDDWDEEMDTDRYPVSPSTEVQTVGSYGLAPTSPASGMVSTFGGSFSSFATAFGDSTSHPFASAGHEGGGENAFPGDEAFLPFLTSAYILPGVQTLLGSLMSPFPDSFSASFESGGIDAAGGNGAGNSGNRESFGVFNILSSLIQASPESLVGPEIVSHITEENCLFEVDLHSLPETASITVGVEGDAVFVEYSNTFSGPSDNTKADDVTEEPGSEHTAGLGKTDESDETGENSAEGGNAAPTEAAGDPEKGTHVRMEKKNPRQNLRGTGGATANVYSYERFVIDPVCDYESADAKAAKVEDDRLLIKFPLKKARKDQASENKDSALNSQPASDRKKDENRESRNTGNMSAQPHSSETEKATGVTHTETKSEKKEDKEHAREAEQVLQKNEQKSAPKRLVEKVSALQSTQPRRRILPLVAAEEF
ncbi:conserved hypothetical protein [Neospora caninum Liverpool]|uniref:SHSP domain-containing protein n=1 Tax=Neospora caninum (strain Liverpool) TaxID=572307 RepID=F0V8X8_NEOCL|nr:conserved hypothetical protein [Neospora caninum Liverpool]CBZ50169.1 conserved hypothetical protein [Neospora caninum Liverpool]CEL64766.1 TPA: hypothetical protein BN1204_006450 [Neospora caninum Liverpool]|eukprot:XP_003880204.1 conserved hypothetical protein [Neospora caninum Liverpool]